MAEPDSVMMRAIGVASISGSMSELHMMSSIVPAFSGRMQSFSSS